jgi:hypothetical protein
MTTIVSAFVSNVNSTEDRNIDKYYTFGKLLLQSTTPKIIFVDDAMFRIIKEEDYDVKNTFIIKYDKTDIYLYNYSTYLDNFSLNTDNPKKDTMEYMFIMCNKTEWIRKAIEIDPFKSDNYVWVDFGIRHVFNCEDIEFIEKLNRVYYKKYDKIRIANIWNLQHRWNVNILTQINWYFAGGVFGGNKEQLLLFSDLMKSKCMEIIFRHNTIMWEVNIWYLIYLENSQLFDPYPSNHNDTLIDNY